MRNCDSDGQLMLFDLESADESSESTPRHKFQAGSLSALAFIPYFHLDLSKGHVNLFGNHYWEFRSPWREAGPPLNTGPAPREPVKCALSEILETNPRRKYYLSKTACLGILRRAEERGKALPPQLKTALMAQAGLIPPDSNGEIPCTAFAANRRDEVRDLHNAAGAVQAQPGMKQQTFVAEGSLKHKDTKQCVAAPERKREEPVGVERHTSPGGGDRIPSQEHLCALAASAREPHPQRAGLAIRRRYPPR